MPDPVMITEADALDRVASGWNALLAGTGMVVIGGGPRGPSTLIVDRLDREGLERSIVAFVSSDDPTKPGHDASPAPTVTRDILDSRPALTRKQEAVLGVVAASISERGYPPAMRKIAATRGSVGTRSDRSASSSRPSRARATWSWTKESRGACGSRQGARGSESHDRETRRT